MIKIIYDWDWFVQELDLMEIVYYFNHIRVFSVFSVFDLYNRAIVKIVFF